MALLAGKLSQAELVGVLSVEVCGCV